MDGDRGMSLVLPQWTSPPVARLYCSIQKCKGCHACSSNLMA